MNSEHSVLVMCVDSLRHKFVANFLTENLNVVGIVCEVKKSNIIGKTESETDIISRHFQERDEKEREYFSGNEDFKLSKDKIFFIEYRRANDEKVFTWIKSRKPEYIILFGSSVIKSPVLNFYKDKVINMHLGLSPYYRGAGTNFWPLVLKEPECIGATIHIATERIDAGPILAQARPQPYKNDRCHNLGCKTVITCANLLPKVISLYENGSLTPKKQDLKKGKFFKSTDFNAQAVLKMWQNFDDGMMDDYIENFENRVNKFPIVEPYGSFGD